MPTYTYRCTNCGVTFDHIQKFTDKPLSRCPECRGKVNRVPQASAVVFKGSGWYINDSKGSSKSSTVTGSKKSETTETKADTAESKAPEKKSTEKAAKTESSAT
ncbi:MAG TPA: zinc ribbon domain-containing protein [Anaerolineales bacterium]|nr:zinc ribbon domain-containing protein [Anaerolineales bacterium]HRF47903.1 zinc ribbon domain-containing protein [Anaerolineales bacterium]